MGAPRGLKCVTGSLLVSWGEVLPQQRAVAAPGSPPPAHGTQAWDSEERKCQPFWVFLPLDSFGLELSLARL